MLYMVEEASNEAERKLGVPVDVPETGKGSAVDITALVRGRIEKIWHRGSRSYAPRDVGAIKWHTPVQRVCADTFLLVIPEGQEGDEGRPIDIGNALLEKLGWQRMTKSRLQALMNTAPKEVTL